MEKKVLKIPAELQEVAERNGYFIEIKPLVYIKGWPHESKRPFQLHWLDGGGYLASFATIEALERNFRGRAGL